MVKNIIHAGQTLAIIISREYKKEGIEFFTPQEFSQQLAYMSRAKDYMIAPHIHRPVPRQIKMTNEVLFIKSGKVRVDFYDNDTNYLESQILKTGDVILLCAGGHGFQMLEDSEMIEVKQGPFAGNLDKTRFQPVADDQIEIKD